MKRNRLPAWTRPDRRKHFVYALTKDMKAIKEQDKAAIKKRVDNALNEIQRFPYVNIKQDTLKLWQNFLAN
jgi:Txe/YoeB family toxin of Txe-Axe toxin-antitoxin module